MPDQSDALTRLVQERVGEGREVRIRTFAERAIDPVTGTTISKSTVGNLLQGRYIKITPEVLGAIAAGLGVPLAKVQAAATAQYVGIIITDPFDTPTGDDDVVVRVARDAGTDGDDLPKTRAFIDDPERRD